MKTPHWFIGTRFVSHLRMAGAVTLMSAAAAYGVRCGETIRPVARGKFRQQQQRSLS